MNDTVNDALLAQAAAWDDPGRAGRPMSAPHEAGAELDALIFTRVFGEEIRCPHGIQCSDIPPFSTDMDAAWTVVERITDPLRGLTNPRTGFPAGTHFAYDFDCAHLWAMSASEAAAFICLAALKALDSARASGEGEP